MFKLKPKLLKCLCVYIIFVSRVLNKLDQHIGLFINHSNRANQQSSRCTLRSIWLHWILSYALARVECNKQRESRLERSLLVSWRYEYSSRAIYCNISTPSNYKLQSASSIVGFDQWLKSYHWAWSTICTFC